MLDIKNKDLTNNGLYNRYACYNEKYFNMIYKHSDYLKNNSAICNYHIVLYIEDSCKLYDELYRKCEMWEHYNSNWYDEIHLLMDDLKGRIINHIKMLEKYLKYESEVYIQ